MIKTLFSEITSNFFFSLTMPTAVRPGDEVEDAGGTNWKIDSVVWMVGVLPGGEEPASKTEDFYLLARIK